MYEKSIINAMANILYWMEELEDDMKHGVFVLSPATFITTWMHDLALAQMAHGNKELDWPKVFEEAQRQARATREAENAKNND